MTDLRPCKDPANDPQDWFIETYGKQYRDDEFPGVTFEAADAEFLRRQEAEPTLDVADVFLELEAAALKDALRRRRHARDKCFECPFRLECLTDAMRIEGEDGFGEIYGTWGGYYPEHRREMYRELERRKKQRSEE